MAEERRVERFQCVMPYPTPPDPQVQIYVQRLIEGEQLGQLYEVQIPLSKFFSPFDLINIGFVDEASKQPNAIPASDRLVAIDHNGSAYQKADAALQRLEEAIRVENSFSSEAEKEAAHTDVSMLRKLLQVAKVRVRLIGGLAATGIGSLLYKFGDKMLGEAARNAWEALHGLIGWLPHWF